MTVKLSEVMIPKYYKMFLDNKHTHTILTSGRAGTKSSVAALLAVYEVVKNDKAAVVVMRKHHNKLRKTVYKEIIRAIRRLGIPEYFFRILKSPLEITYLGNGNTIYFTGSDSVEDTKGLIDENSPITLVILDELTEFFERGDGEDEITNIIATFSRGNDERFRMIYLFNPPKNPNAPVMEWTEKMESREDCQHIHTSYKDVPENWLGSKLIEEAAALEKMDPKRYRWIWLGECVGIDDLIYYMYKPDEHIQSLPRDSKFKFYYIGVDYGQMNATAYEAFGLNSDFNLIGIDEYYYSGRDEGRQKTPGQYAKDMRQLLNRIYKKFGKKAAYIYIDPSAKGLAEEIKKQCPEAIIRNAKNDVRLGINRTQVLFSSGKLFLCKKQKMLSKELLQYSYDPDSIERGDEKPLKVFDHAVDALRYACMGSWQYTKVRGAE